ncbi:Iron siderophore sensor protein [Pseudomonas paraeruginosa]|nr:Iron siderophore sensor protein [Pseudomonas aeruginosa]
MTRTDSDATPCDPALEQTAQAWLVRLRGTSDVAIRRAFEDWLAQRPEHAQAYARAETLWRLTEMPATRLALEEADALEIYLRSRRAPRNPRRWAYPLASVACLLAMLWLGGWWQPGDWLQDWRADYVAAPGQVAEWKLADGSYLSLDAGSAVRVRIDGGQRRVELLRGAVALRVKRDALPFVVEAGEGRARVLGTEFEVRRGAGATRVTVLQGRVAVSAGTGAGAAEEVLGAGQQVGFADGELGRPVAVNDAAALARLAGLAELLPAAAGGSARRTRSLLPRPHSPARRRARPPAGQRQLPQRRSRSRAEVAAGGTRLSPADPVRTPGGDPLTTAPVRSGAGIFPGDEFFCAAG